MAVSASASADAPRPRRRLFWKYVVVIVALVTTVLVASAGVELWFSYREAQDAIIAIQHEKAGAAATRIEAFIREIERQMGWTAQPLLASGTAALEQRRIDFLRLLRQVPPITELSHIDAEGKEQLRVSRLAMDVAGSGTDLSAEPRFTQAIARRVYHGPVTFRKESEPYMVVSMAQSGGGVTVAEVNLKFIWDVVTQIKIGKAGRAYVVDEGGNLIAHPDISLVLQKTSLATLPQVRDALTAGATQSPLARDVHGKRVLTASATIPGLRWTVFTEQPLEEALAPLQASLKRSVLLLVVGISLAIGASLVLARRMVRPIQALHEGATRIAGGELGHRIDVHTGDELQALAAEFNRMTAHLRESYATLEQRVADRTRELSESLEQQTATSEVLGVMSESPTDAQPVFERILRNAIHLSGADFGAVFRLDEDGVLRAAAVTDINPQFAEYIRSIGIGIQDNTVLAHAARELRPVHTADITSDPRFVPLDAMRSEGMRSVLAVPMVREGKLIGALAFHTRAVHPFTEKQIALVSTFARQAVIAIENVRLFTELQRRNAEVTEALEQQTATADILRVISQSPTDVQPVLDALAESATRVCGASDAIVLRVDDGMIRRVAHFGDVPTSSTPLRPLNRDSVAGRAILECRTIQVDDLHEIAAEYPLSFAMQRDVRTVVVTPLVREGAAMGALVLRRLESRRFSEKQVALLETFASQAVIAIENVRLFTELQARNAEVTEALEQQTATSEVLRVISQSPTDVQPVLNVVAENAARVCGANDAIIFRIEDDVARRVAHFGILPLGLDGQPSPPMRRITRGSVLGRAVVERRTIQVADLLDDAHAAEFPEGVALARKMGHRTVMATPLMREGVAVGVIIMRRGEVKPFSAKQLALLETFASQAVIAIENVRLFTELQERNAEVTEALEQQTATGEILRAISRAQTDVQPVFEVIASSALRLCEGVASFVFRREGALIHLAAFDSAGGIDTQKLRQVFPAPVESATFVGRAITTGQVLYVRDIPNDPNVPPGLVEFADANGFRSIYQVPMLREGHTIGAIAVTHHEVDGFTPKQGALLETFADQAVIAIENARLFTELQERTAQLQVANRHKDEFLANMSHELRTPLNAIIGFSEVMLERMFGDLNEKQDEYLQDILSSGRHLLSLINDILDLSKIEAGKMELDLTDFNLAAAIDNALTLVHERAARRGLVLGHDVDPAIDDLRGDERKIKQVLLNLLSNAIKFTPEGGRVDVRAVLKGDVVEISVADTGVGIAPEDQEAVFEEFRQVGTDVAKKHEGTGLGLALTRRFVELHGGNIWLESEPGVGSTFTFALPVRR